MAQGRVPRSTAAALSSACATSRSSSTFLRRPARRFRTLGGPHRRVDGAVTHAARTKPWNADARESVLDHEAGMAALVRTGSWTRASSTSTCLSRGVIGPWSSRRPTCARSRVRWLLDHSGLVAVRTKPLPPPAMFEWDTMWRWAEQAPWVGNYGTAHGYHALTFGWLVGEMCGAPAARASARISATRSRVRSAPTSTSTPARRAR